MTTPETFQGGGFELNAEQLALLEVAGVPLRNPVAPDLPQSIEEFREISINNLSWYFNKWPIDFDNPAAGQFSNYDAHHFQRLQVLFPDFVDETFVIETELNRLSKVSNDSLDFVEYDSFYREQAEPRFFFAWVAMSSLIDKEDESFQKMLEKTRGNAERAVWLILSL